MPTKAHVLACVMFAGGCGGHVSLGDNVEPTSVDDSGSDVPDAVFEASSPRSDAVADTATPNGPFPIARVDELTGPGAPRVLVVLGDCTVLSDGIELGKGDATRCSNLWMDAFDTTAFGTCTPDGTTHTVTLFSTDGSSSVKNQDDYCTPGLPGIATRKSVYAVLYSVSGS